MTATTATKTTGETAGEGRSSADLRIRAVEDRADRLRWSRFLEHADGATLFHQPDWCDAVERVFSHTPRHLIAERRGQTVGVLPLMEIHSLLAGTLLVSVPYGTYGGVVASDADVGDALAERAASETRRLNARCLELRSRYASVDAFTTDRRYAGFTRDLPATRAELETFLPRKARAAARQARGREGLTIRHDRGLLPVVWRLYARSMRRLGSVNYPYQFFEELAGRFGDDAWITAVLRDGRMVAGLLSFVYRDTVLPYFLGVDERVRCTGATNLIYLAVMERAVEQGLRRFDFGRTRKGNRGAFEFKTHQGFEPRELGYQRYVPPGRTAPDLTPANPRFAAARRVWRHLPLPLTRSLGAWISSSLPG